MPGRPQSGTARTRDWQTATRRKLPEEIAWSLLGVKDHVFRNDLCAWFFTPTVELGSIRRGTRAPTSPRAGLRPVRRPTAWPDLRLPCVASGLRQFDIATRILLPPT